MLIHTARSIDDVQDVKEFFGDETWDHARRFLEGAPDDPFADHLRWMEENGRPIACVQVFLHQYPIGRAHVGMCLPEYPFVPPELRGRSHFRRLMADLFEWLRGNGYPLAYSHGRKGLYTSIGYAPCMHHCTVLIRVDDALRPRASRRAEHATDEDVDANERAFRRPFPLGRGLQCRDEGWRPDPECVRLIRRSDGSGISAFAVTGQVVSGRKEDGTGWAGFRPADKDGVLTVTDIWARSIRAAAALLRTVAEEAADAGFRWIKINCRRTDPLARIAVLTGGELRWSAAQERSWTDEAEDVDAFYLTDLRLALEQLLPELNRRWSGFGGRVPSALRLVMEEEEQVTVELGPEVALADSRDDGTPCMRLPREAMTRAVMGYAKPTELSLLHAGCRLPPECRAAADALFPAREPHLIHEGRAFATPDQLGLVP
jgi:GNAT superfamily N-acetyltransferase